jgi:hypothetical protein
MNSITKTHKYLKGPSPVILEVKAKSSRTAAIIIKTKENAMLQIYRLF